MYKVQEDFFRKALTKASTDSLFSPVSLGERYNVKLKPGFETACWAYLPPHNIYIGTGIFDKKGLKPGLSEERLSKYVENHYHHELGHALFTERDAQLVKSLLKEISAPFRLFNLFEDALIEHRYRKEAEYQFEWLTIERLGFQERPESLLFALIQAEGNFDVVRGALATWVAEQENDARKALAEKMPRVEAYYKRIVEATASVQLMPLMNAWLDEFGRPPQDAMQQGMQDMEQSMALMSGGEEAKEFDKDAKPVSGPATEQDGQSGKSDAANKAEDFREGSAGGLKTAQGADESVAETGTLLRSYRTPFDKERADTLAAKFVKFFTAQTRVNSTRTPQKRISARHFSLGRAPYRKADAEGRGLKSIFFEVDCSGSMSGMHIEEGRLILSALSSLARKGLIRGHVALSAVYGKASYQTFALPLADETIERIDAFASAEGLEQTLQSNKALAMAADYVFVYTDGQICDRPIDKSRLHQYGIYTWGLYVGEDERYFDSLSKYFDKALLRKSAEDLVDAMLAQR